MIMHKQRSISEDQIQIAFDKLAHIMTPKTYISTSTRRFIPGEYYKTETT
jgi:hypothetical protein